MHGVRRAMEFRRVLGGAQRNAFLCLLDFSYQHYALGDLLTTVVEMGARATDAGCRTLDVAVYSHPGRPSSPLQPFVTPDNYVLYVDNVLPALTSAPMLGGIRIVRDAATANYALAKRLVSGAPFWPPLMSHLRRRQKWPIDHHLINDFYRRRGYIPKLKAPLGHEGWARRFRAERLGGRVVVTVNVRQSGLSRFPRSVYRDAPMHEWLEFFRRAERTAPECIFVVLGGYEEWEYPLQRRPNVLIPRAMGLNLAHELALLAVGDAFMGTSSGFATFATFTSVPYCIVNIEGYFAEHAGISAGDQRYVFGSENQLLTWGPETAESLLAALDRLLGGAGAAKRARGPSGRAVVQGQKRSGYHG
jgi:hypothetical protein